VHCNTCGAALFIDTRKLFLHQQIDPIFDENKALGLLRRWLQTKEIPGVPTRQEAVLQWWPLWELEHNGTKTLLLASPSAWGELEKIDISSGMRNGFDPDRAGEVVVPQRCASAVLKNVKTNIEPTLRLLHVPIYKIRYQLDSENWEALMDGVQGQIYTENMPTPHTSHLDISHAIAFVITTTIFTVEGYFLHGFWAILVAYAISGTGLYFLFNRFLLGRLNR